MNIDRQIAVDSVGMETKHLRERRKPTPNAFEDAGFPMNKTESIQQINVTDTSFNFTNNTTLIGNGTNSEGYTYSQSDMIWTVLWPICMIMFCVFGQRANVPSSQYHRGEMIRRQAERVWAIQRVKTERQAIPTETRKSQIDEGLCRMKIASKCSQTGHCVLEAVELEENKESSTSTEEDTKTTCDGSLDVTGDERPSLPAPTASVVAAATSSGPTSSNISCPESPGRTERKPLLSADSEDSEDNFGITEVTSDLSQPPPNDCATTNNHQACYDFEDDEDVCPICLDNFEVGDTVMFSRHKDGSCAHVFHEECLLQWLLEQRENECPTCRACFIADLDSNSIISSSSSTVDSNENSIVESDEDSMVSDISGDIEEGNCSSTRSNIATNDENNNGDECTFDPNISGEKENITDEIDEANVDIEGQDFRYIIVKGSVQRLPLSHE